MHDDDHDDAPITQRSVRAGSKPPPASSAPISVFDAGRKAKPARRPPERIDLSAVQIIKGAPIPPRITGRAGGNGAKAVLAQMAPGDSVVLSKRQAESFVRAANHLRIKIARRRVGDDLTQVWRTA